MTSQYGHGYQFDLFFSYSTRDVEWVRAFCGDLIADVNRLAEKDVYPFLDKLRLQPGHVWDDVILESVANSAILVPILSPRFLDSDYCTREMNRFLERHPLTGGASNRSPVVPVRLLCGPPSDHVLSKVQSEAFYEDESGVPFEYQAGSPEYKGAVRKTAYSIAQTLNELPAPSVKRPSVFFASDFKPHSEKLRASLRHSFDVLPENPLVLLGLGPDELRMQFETEIAKCFVSVHVISDSLPAKALMELQLAVVKQRKLPKLVWTPGSAAPPGLANAGFECNFSNQADLEDRIRRIHEKPKQIKPPGGGTLVYFICPDRKNAQQAQPLIRALEDVGVYTMPSPVDGPAERAMESHLKALNELDGCLIYYGEVDREWFDAIFLRIRRTIQKRRLPSAIYTGPPETEHKKIDLSHCGVPLLSQTSKEEAARMFMSLFEKFEESQDKTGDA